MRLAIATIGGHPRDPRVWSGIPMHLVHAVGPMVAHLELIGPVGATVHTAGRALSSLTRRAHRKVNWEVEPLILRRLTAALAKELGQGPTVDAVLTLGWMPYAHMLSVPAAYWGDATYAQRVDHAPHWSNLGRRTRRRLEVVEGELLRGMTDVLMPSRWAGDDVVRRYGVDPRRLHIIPFGANLDTPPPSLCEWPSSPTRLLLVGVEWHRKGVDRAVHITDELRRRGVNAVLDVVGVLPPSRIWEREYVTYHGRLSKAQPSDVRLLDHLYREAHLFVLPTRSDPFPVVLGEAAAYGLPAIATGVGGVPERIKRGETGVLLAPDADDGEWADAVISLREDPAAYRRLAVGARQHFDVAANWERAASALVSALSARG